MIGPAIPAGGLAGFRFLEKTYDRQFAAFSDSASIQREVDYFMENAAEVTEVEQLMGDRRLLAVALGAFGLDDDIDKRAFIRKVLDEGTLEDSAFANRLVEPAYREMAKSLGFGDVGSLLPLETLRQDIADRFLERQFELAVGETDLSMRLALNFKREAAKIASESNSEQTMWLRLLGSAPLRSVVESAFNLPSQFGLVDLDRQVEEVMDRASQFLEQSDRAALQDPEILDSMVQRFLLIEQVNSGVTSTSTRGATALTLLQSSPLGSIGQQNLFQSGFL